MVLLIQLKLFQAIGTHHFYWIAARSQFAFSYADKEPREGVLQKDTHPGDK